MKFSDFDDFEIKPDEPVFTSGVVTRLLDVPIWVLKQLDSEGIVSPDRQARCARLYSRRDLRKIQFVWRLMDERGVTLNGVRVILEMNDEDS